MLSKTESTKISSQNSLSTCQISLILKEPPHDLKEKKCSTGYVYPNWKTVSKPIENSSSADQFNCWKKKPFY